MKNEKRMSERLIEDQKTLSSMIADRTLEEIDGGKVACRLLRIELA